GMCGNQVLAEYPSPDGRMKVTVFQRDCGATTRSSTQASLMTSRRTLPAGGGNIFVADDRRGATPQGPGGGPRVDVRWISDKQVVLRRHKAASVFKAERRYEGIDVTYETYP